MRLVILQLLFNISPTAYFDCGLKTVKRLPPTFSKKKKREMYVFLFIFAVFCFHPFTPLLMVEVIYSDTAALSSVLVYQVTFLSES